VTAISVRQACGPAEARRFGTDELRSSFLIEDLFSPGRVSMTYSHVDRVVVGGALPLGDALPLLSSKPIGSDTFLGRREIGIINIGGDGVVEADSSTYDLAPRDCIYVAMGRDAVSFKSKDASRPAKFYFISYPAHARHETRKIGVGDANRIALGEPAQSNVRTIRQYIHPDICRSCQLVMGVTTLEMGSVWNTMPCHTHDRRSEVYLYFGMEPEARVFHFMGEPEETRHLVVANDQAVISPGWSIHCGAGTSSYSFVWAMGGDNQSFADMDMVAMETLR
jgi:4-deoxy-L-threo-5-hexosulose-uronate ketol-isomerase